jgi:hypothetical protein
MQHFCHSFLLLVADLIALSGAINYFWANVHLSTVRRMQLYK